MTIAVDLGRKATEQTNKMNIIFTSANSSDPDEMLPYGAMHLGFTVYQSTCLQVSRMKRLTLEVK